MAEQIILITDVSSGLGCIDISTLLSSLDLLQERDGRRSL